MRERVALHGGTLRAGPAADGGWLVEAILRTAAPRPGGVPA
jgi:signal transduction histidine kinase